MTKLLRRGPVIRLSFIRKHRSVPMLLRKKLISLLATLTLLSTVTGCAKQVTIRPLFPPAPDIEALQESKPRPSPDILLSSKASAQYNADVEGWGERLAAAVRRTCIWLQSQGMKVS